MIAPHVAPAIREDRSPGAAGARGARRGRATSDQEGACCRRAQGVRLGVLVPFVAEIGFVAFHDAEDKEAGTRKELQNLANFGKMSIIFGCIGADLYKQIRVLQHFSKPTRLFS